LISYINGIYYSSTNISLKAISKALKYGHLTAFKMALEEKSAPTLILQPHHPIIIEATSAFDV